jgi:toxin-antitoxin system PIN domain toxin
MRIGVDTNVLIYAHMSSFKEHAAVRQWLLTRLEDRDVRLAVTPMILHELVHVITDDRRFSPPVEMSEALSLARHYLRRDNVECLLVDEPAMIRALDLLERHRLGRKRVADALLAATLLEARVDTLLTCNTKDFTVFDELKLIDPRQSAG